MEDANRGLERCCGRGVEIAGAGCNREQFHVLLLGRFAVEEQMGVDRFRCRSLADYVRIELNETYPTYPQFHVLNVSR